jgi:hypothetical protein
MAKGSTVVPPDAAVAHGHWRVTRGAETLSGPHALVLRKSNANGSIVSDTTTSAG